MCEASCISYGEWRGKTLAEVCERFGNPDLIEPASYYSAKFLNSDPSVVLTYNALGCRWFIGKEGYVLDVLPIKR